MYTATELARAAGFLIVRTAAGGVRPVDHGDGRMVLELGPDATECQIVAAAAPYLEVPERGAYAEIAL